MSAQKCLFVSVCVCLYLCMRACVCMCACDRVLLCVMMCVLVLTFYIIWTCKTKLILKPQRSTITFKSFILAQVHFCTLLVLQLHKAPCSSKREHVLHKNDTKWFGIDLEHSFIWYLILNLWSMIYALICIICIRLHANADNRRSPHDTDPHASPADHAPRLS